MTVVPGFQFDKHVVPVHPFLATTVVTGSAAQWLSRYYGMAKGLVSVQMIAYEEITFIGSS